jgi:PleD family two-component response regulator
VSHSKPTILVADDTPTNIELVEAILGAEFEILFAPDGVVAVEIAQAEVPDLILMDVMMPILDGYEACQRIKADAKTCEIPIIFVTALADNEALMRAFASGGVDYVSKPFHPDELRARVATHIALKHALDKERALRVQLEEAMTHVKQLSGLLPICAQCKKIRDKQGQWNPMEVYISEHSEADFTHGLCPDCIKAFMAKD